jgi:hypothetical protein
MHGLRRIRGVALAVTACACALMLGGATAVASVPSPTVTPATGGAGVAVIPGFTAFDPAAVGYQQSEIFLSGTAHSYGPAAPLGTDGKFSVTEASAAPYTTRAVVMRPVDPARFNGTVIVEWLNVSGGNDAGPAWMVAHNELVREGFAWVGVSAQKVGVDALKSTTPGLGDAVRYAGLSHPGDSYSYDIFSQAGQAIRDNAKTVFGGLKPGHVIATGESQSAFRLVTYIDAVHPIAHVYDGYLVVSRFGYGAPLSQAPEPDVAVPAPTPIRDDLGVPVLVFQTETDVFLSNLGARQPDSRTYRLWEVPGTAHFDIYGLNIGKTDIGDGQAGAKLLDSMLHPTNQPDPHFSCIAPINTGPAHFVLDTAVSSINRWVAYGVLPPVASRLQTTGTDPVVFATDAHGNVLGGVRTPAVDAPVAVLSGIPPQGNDFFCALFGTTVPLTSTALAELYPNHGTFVKAWAKAATSALAKGFLVPADAQELLSAAAKSDVGS